MKKISVILLICTILNLFCTGSYASSSIIPFCDVINKTNITDISHGIYYYSYADKYADIESEDLMRFLKPYWNFNYERVIAPSEAYNISGDYIKIWNLDKSEAYIIFANGGVIAGKYGEPCQSHDETRTNYVWYLPIIGNSRNALHTATETLKQTYFINDYEDYKGGERAVTPDDKIVFPEKNLLDTSSASDWAKDEIQTAAAYNLLVYDVAQNFSSNITRADFCRLAYRTIATEFSPYSDSRLGLAMAINDVLTERNLSASLTYTDTNDLGIINLTAMGIIEGMGDGTFAPDSYLTREQAATILLRMAMFLGNKTIPSALNIHYADDTLISDWAKQAVGIISEMGIMNGMDNNNFAPKAYYTTEQAIATLLRLYDAG